MKNAAARVRQFFDRDAFVIVGVEASKHYKRSFQRDHQGFTDKKLERWQPLKPETVERKARRNGTTPPILTDQGHLADSIDWNADYGRHEVVMSSDRPYAQVHNEGGTAGRGGAATIPQRQFMGPSQAMEEKIIEKFERTLDNILR